MFSLLENLDSVLWTYAGAGLIILLGCFLTVQSGALQIRRFFQTVRIFFSFLKEKEDADQKGAHPIKVFFAAIGGAIGVGNIVGIVTSVQLGGPGALFWTWIAAFFGMIIKYSEVYLGIRYRQPNKEGGYDGGPMFFLKKAFKNKWVPNVVTVLLCVYGVEIYIFGVVADSISINWHCNRFLVVAVLLLLVLWGAGGGIKRVGKICSVIIPLFLTLYLIMSVRVIFQYADVIPGLLSVVFKSAFTGHAAIGGFAGSYFLLTMSQGIARGCYSGDIGIGYASIVHSESQETRPSIQASLAIFGVFLDTFIVCTLSVLLILLTGIWHEPISSSLLVQEALNRFFPFMRYFMPVFLFLLGYSTVITYLYVGLKCANLISPKKGKRFYYGYAIFSLILFPFFDASKALIIMSIFGGLLMIINVCGIYRLRKEIVFELDNEPTKEPKKMVSDII